MSIIVIKDLPENLDLDRQAMIAITGGARSRQAFLGRAPFGNARIVNYPGGFNFRRSVDANARAAEDRQRE